MFIENRNRKRFYPEGIVAHIIIEPSLGGEIRVDGQVVDMSYSGIKIKLKEPFSHLFEAGELRISLILPESGVTVSIHGMIKHVINAEEYGLQYLEKHAETEMDDLMFECIKFAPPEVYEPLL